MSEELQSYGGSCHCGRVKFKVNLKIERLLRCNCSICSKTGALWVFGPKAELDMLTEASALGDYQFGAKKLTHHFCKSCGIECFADGVAPDGTQTVGVNVRSLDDFDLEAFEIIDYDGASL